MLGRHPTLIAIANTDVCRRWWQHMRDIMPGNVDASPISQELREVFHMDHELRR
jgi:L-rhamnose mutarotase